MTDRRERDDELLRRLEAGDFDDERGRAELEAELEEVAERLDATGADVRAEVEAARRGGPESPLVGRTLRRLAAEEGRAAAARRALPYAWMAAAALLLFALWLGFGRDRGSEPHGPPQILGPPTLQLVRPLGEVDRYAPFRWKGELPQGGYFVLRVFERLAEGSGASPRELVTSPHLRDFEWSPPEELLSDQAGEIHWQVERYEPAGALEEARSGDARLRSR